MKQTEEQSKKKRGRPRKADAGTSSVASVKEPTTLLPRPKVESKQTSEEAITAPMIESLKNLSSQQLTLLELFIQQEKQKKS
jgi:hypothetical protein